MLIWVAKRIDGFLPVVVASLAMVVGTVTVMTSPSPGMKTVVVEASPGTVRVVVMPWPLTVVVEVRVVD